jgi:hypothetical protein
MTTTTLLAAGNAAKGQLLPDELLGAAGLDLVLTDERRVDRIGSPV